MTEGMRIRRCSHTLKLRGARRILSYIGHVSLNYPVHILLYPVPFDFSIRLKCVPGHATLRMALSWQCLGMWQCHGTAVLPPRQCAIGKSIAQLYVNPIYNRVKTYIFFNRSR